MTSIRGYGGQFAPIGEETMVDKPVSVRLPLEVYKLIAPLPKRAEWLRRVISEAAERELMRDSET